MSVEVKVALNTGASMGYENDHTAASPERALVALDQGYKQIREWLLTQLSPADQSRYRLSPIPKPEPEKRTQEIVRETIEDDLRTGRGWRV